MQTVERRGICRYQIHLSLCKGDPSVVYSTNRQQFFKRKALSTGLDRRRKVRFSSIKTALLEDVPPASHMLEEEKNALWWNKKELNETYENIAQLMRSFSKRPRNNNGTQAYHTILYKLDENCRRAAMGHEEDVDYEDMKILANWHRNSLTKRGLEKLMLNNIEDNAKIRETIIHAVSSMFENETIDESIKFESIRVCSERLTRQARLFAKVLGDADAASVLPHQSTRRIRRATELLQ